MKINRSFFCFSIFVMATLMMVSCQKNRKSLSLGVIMEQPTDSTNAKTYLGHAEEWMYWENGDSLMCKLKGVDNPQGFHLTSGHKQLTAVFETNDDATIGEEVNTREVYAIYPISSFGSIDADKGTGTIIFPAKQEYRNSHDNTYPTNQAQHPDSSFGRGAMPMVAYESGGLKSGLYFHVVAGMLRVELFSTATEKTIESISFTEVSDPPKQISGSFAINGIKTYRPFLTGTSVADGNNTITITNINQTIGGNKLLNFYLALPAVGGSDSYTLYDLKMVVKTTSGEYYVKRLKADIHRRNITFMRAVNISQWTSSSDQPTTTGLTDVHVVGCGTKDRPFEIYSSTELVQVRDAINNHGTINGQTLGDKTYYKIARSDIKLTTDNWTSGIENFTGYMYFSSSSARSSGITNESDVPIFVSIASGGKVERLNVKGSHSYAGSSDFSPFCTTNNGTIIDCHNQCSVNSLYGKNLAGICVTNNGTIYGGANEANLISTNQGGGNVAGVCLYNNKTIQGNFTLSSALPKGCNVAGICYRNNSQGTIVDCQLSANAYQYNATGNWGGIVFDNQGTVDNCVSSGTVIFTTTGSIGGIANTNSGTISNCSNRINRIEGKAGSTGGICGTMTDGFIYNSFSAASATVVGYQRGTTVSAQYGGNAGGIVGKLTGGYVVNCYNRSMVSNATNSGGIVGAISYGYVANCYNGNGKNFCGGTMDDVSRSTCLKKYCYNLAPEAGCRQFGVAVDTITDKLNDWVTNPANPLLNDMNLSSNPFHEWKSPASAPYYPYLSDQAPRPFTGGNPYTDTGTPGSKKHRR